MKPFYFLGLLLAISLSVPWALFAQAPPKREFRAAWIATVTNLDWPAAGTYNPDVQKSQLIAILNELKVDGVNAVMFQVRPECDALYQSSIEPWSYYLTGVQGSPPVPYYDPLEFAVQEAHKRGMEIHAWFNPYRAVRSVGSYPLSPNHVSVAHPDWILSFAAASGQPALKILDPGLPQVREYVARVVSDIVRRYDVDGLHADDYFYPYPPQQITNQDDSTFAHFSRGFTNRDDWRRDNVNLLMKQIRDSVLAIKPWVKFGMSPFGIWKNGVPAGISGLDAYSTIYGDAIQWLHDHSVDYLTPQLYWKIGGGQDYSKLMPWWADSCSAYDRHLYTGHIFGSYSTSELPNQVRLNRANPKVGGSVFFRAANFAANTLTFADSLRQTLYVSPSLLPVMAWKDTVPPYMPRALRYETLAGTGLPALQWDLPLTAPDGDSAARYAVYRFDHAPSLPSELADSRNLVSVEGGRSSIPPIPPGSGPYYYVTTALDRNYNESEPSSVLEVSGAPAAPILASPANGFSSVPESVLVVWRKEALAALYELQVSGDSSFQGSLFVDDPTLTDTVRWVKGLTGQTTYYWRVKAANAGGSGAFSSAFQFFTGFPRPPVALYPPNQTPNIPISPVFTWNLAAAATSYHVQLATTADYAHPVADTSGITDTTLSLGQLQYYTVYYWHVMASNAIGPSDWSSSARFRTVQVTAVDEQAALPTVYALENNYPNPFNPSTTISYAIPKTGRVVLKVYDVLGNEVSTLVDVVQEPGRYRVVWDASGRASGVYFCRIFAGSFVKTERMLLVK